LVRTDDEFTLLDEVMFI